MLHCQPPTWIYFPTSALMHVVFLYLNFMPSFLQNSLLNRNFLPEATTAPGSTVTNSRQFRAEKNLWDYLVLNLHFTDTTKAQRDQVTYAHFYSQWEVEAKWNLVCLTFGGNSSVAIVFTIHLVINHVLSWHGWCHLQLFKFHCLICLYHDVFSQPNVIALWDGTASYSDFLQDPQQWFGISRSSCIVNNLI